MWDTEAPYSFSYRSDNPVKFWKKSSKIFITDRNINDILDRIVKKKNHFLCCSCRDRKWYKFIVRFLWTKLLTNFYWNFLALLRRENWIKYVVQNAVRRIVFPRNLIKHAEETFYFIVTFPVQNNRNSWFYAQFFTVYYYMYKTTKKTRKWAVVWAEYKIENLVITCLFIVLC